MSGPLSAMAAQATDHPPVEKRVAGSVRFLPIASLRTTYAALRVGCPDRSGGRTAALPLRVVPTDDGFYEVVDGFKRLRSWGEAGYTEVPVVLERPGCSEELKCLLLEANCPARTLTALDEARVVYSLLNEDGLSVQAVARQLRKKPQWVARRVDVATRLSATAEEALAHGRIGPTLAHALCALSAADQDALLGCIAQHELKPRESIALCSAYRVADEADRASLLRDPLRLLRPEVDAHPAATAEAAECETGLQQIRQALESLAAFVIPEQLAPAERRRLEACLRGVLAQLQATAQRWAVGGEVESASEGEAAIPSPRVPVGQGDSDESPQREGEPHERDPRPASQRTGGFNEPRAREGRGAGGDSTTDRAPACILRQPADCRAGGVVAQGRSTGPEGAGLPGGAPAGRTLGEAGALPAHHRGASLQGTDHQQDPARDPSAGLPRWPQHSRRVCAKASEPTRPETSQGRQASLRDPAGGGDADRLVAVSSLHRRDIQDRLRLRLPCLCLTQALGPLLPR